MTIFPADMIVRVVPDNSPQDQSFIRVSNDFLIVQLSSGTKDEIIQSISEILNFPREVNNAANWDAFRDWLGDLSWLKGRTVELEVRGLRHLVNNDISNAAHFFDIMLELNSINDRGNFPLRVRLKF